jgi:hypothetical protein
MGLFRRLFKPNIKKMERKKDVNGLVKAMWFDDLNIRIDSIKALDRIGPDAKQAVPALLQALRDTNDIIRERAVCALGQIKDERAVEPLIKSLSDKYIRREAVYALGEIGDSRTVQPLIGLLEVPEMVIPAIRVLGSLNDKRAVEPLLKQLRSLDKEIREATVTALYNLDEVPNFDRMKKFWENRESERRKSEAYVRARIGDLITRARVYASQMQNEGERDLLTFVHNVYEIIRLMEKGAKLSVRELNQSSQKASIIDYLEEEHSVKRNRSNQSPMDTDFYVAPGYSLTGQYRSFFPKTSRKRDIDK